MSAEPSQDELDLAAIKSWAWQARRFIRENEGLDHDWLEPLNSTSSQLGGSVVDALERLVAELERVRAERDALRGEVKAIAGLMRYGDGETVPTARYNGMISSARSLLEQNEKRRGV